MLTRVSTMANGWTALNMERDFSNGETVRFTTAISKKARCMVRVNFSSLRQRASLREGLNVGLRSKESWLRSLGSMRESSNMVRCMTVGGSLSGMMGGFTREDSSLDRCMDEGG